HDARPEIVALGLFHRARTMMSAGSATGERSAGSPCPEGAATLAIGAGGATGAGGSAHPRGPAGGTRAPSEKGAKRMGPGYTAHGPKSHRPTGAKHGFAPLIFARQSRTPGS